MTATAPKVQVVISGTKVCTTAYASALEIAISGTQRITKTYYSAGSQLIAMRVVTSTGGNALYFLSSDHLGSSSLTTDASGNVVARQLYDAWGNVRSGGAMPTDIGFTGQRLDATGLMFYKARYYSQQIGRFISADTLVPDPNSPQHFNRYSYANNNPLKFVDPTGHCAKNDPDYAVCKNEVDYIQKLYGVLLTDGTAFWDILKAQLVQSVLDDIAGIIGTAAVFKTWSGVEMVMMAQTGSPTGSAWTPPGDNGKRIELPASGTGYWSDESWTRNVIAEELGHSWDMRSGQNPLGGWGTIVSGNRLSNGLVDAVHAEKGTFCFTFLDCDNYDPGPENTVDGGKWKFVFSIIPLYIGKQGGHAATGPVEDWGGAFATYFEPTFGRHLYQMRKDYVQHQLALLVNGQ